VTVALFISQFGARDERKWISPVTFDYGLKTKQRKLGELERMDIRDMNAI
jgi:hypothetical protein